MFLARFLLRTPHPSIVLGSGGEDHVAADEFAFRTGTGFVRAAGHLVAVGEMGHVIFPF